ncbi:hypothetical protein PRZ48_012370 [Zasmidium cellare]|uniref:Alpha/beta hydrolase fold-3 domain-containing protein n=1 Tax=Zasmidium cellare TaxID=395010 RepID=A0ABR0E554_ZASCE|nr:hypothetical protein PRZ48_012370 [Zasmidium cellare]
MDEVDALKDYLQKQIREAEAQLNQGNYALMEKKEFAYKTVTHNDKTSTELTANVYYTPPQTNESTNPRPIALHFHGGGFVVGSKDDTAAIHLEFLLGHGFVVVAPNYRLCPTILAIEEPVQDSLDCYEWARSDLPKLLQPEGITLDTERLVALGSSCGGTIAHHMTKASLPPLAILDIACQKFLRDPCFTSGVLPPGYTSLPPLSQSFIDQVYSEVPAPASSPVPWGPEGMDFSRPRFAWMFSTGSKGTVFREITPGGDTDTLDPDSLVKVDLARRAHEMLKAKGVESELIVVEGKDHGVDEEVKKGERDYEDVARAFEFLKMHVEA